VEPRSARALAEALGVESTWRSLRLPRWDPVLLGRLTVPWQVSAHWPIQGAPISLEVSSEGVLTGAAGLHAAALSAVTGLSLSGTGVSVERFDPGRAREVAAAVFGWRREEQSFVLAN
jgi:hypothetical protein